MDSGHQKGSGNFRRRKAAQGSQRQPDLRFRVQRRMAARKNQPQAIVGKIHLRGFPGGVVIRTRNRSVVEEFIFLVATGLSAAGIVNQLAMTDGGNPGGGIVQARPGQASEPAPP